MCSPATCRQCGKTTWTGCGLHAHQVMSRVPAAQQCSCDGDALDTSVGQSGRAGGLRGLFRR